jgi:hypothetical protein
MKFRAVTLFNGLVFQVPSCVQRIDHRTTHGWQLRYGGTKLFSDFSADGSGAAQSLALATRELMRRIATQPAPSRLQAGAGRAKPSGLPVGISGPVVRTRRGGRVRDCSLAVLIPRFGAPPQRRTVYIGTENTYTAERFEAALARAVAMRRDAERAYRRAETRARRAAALALRQPLPADAVDESSSFCINSSE